MTDPHRLDTPGRPAAPALPADRTHALLHSTDWSRTPIGPMADWPKALRGYADMILEMPTPAVIFWGPDQTQIYNDGYAEIMGPRHPRYFGAAYRDCWPDTYPLIHPWMRHVLETGGTWKVEREHIPVTRHGFEEEAYFTFAFSPLRDDAGRIAGILQPVFDVTASVLADRRADLLRQLVPEQQSGVSPIDDALAAMAGSAADLPFARVWLWNADHARLAPAGGMGVALPSADVVLLDEAAAAAWTQHAPEVVDRLSAVKDARLRAVLLVPLAGAPGAAPAGVVGFGISPRLHFDDKYREFLDLVARQLASGLQRAQAGRAAERQRQHLAELFMQAPAGIAVLGGADHVFELVNPAYDEFTGYRELLGKPLRVAMPELRGRGTARILDDVFRSGVAYVGSEVPSRLRRGLQDGDEAAFFNFVYQPVRDELGITSGILIFAYEVTEQVRARRAAEQLADELRAEHRRKDDFLAMLAHELRNPLAPISAAAEVLRVGHAADPKLRRTSEIVTRQVRHMATLIDDLLDASRVTRGIVTIDRQEQDLRDIASAALEQVAPQIEAQRHRLDVRLGDVPVVVSGDRKRLVQTLTNLLDNAAKYTPPGGRIELQLEQGAAEATLRVRDNGQGVPAALHERIFDLFVQGQRSADRAQGGLGIGLALARRLVELHGGTLVCTSAGADQGSEFTLRLPRPASSAAQAPAEASDAPHATGATATTTAGPSLPAANLAAGLRILIVDDNEDAAHMLAMLLEGAGHEVTTESDPLVALDHAPAVRPDVCLLDIGLPRMDGHALAQRLRAGPATRAATLIALTGYGQAADREKAAQAGFDHYLVKPPNIEELTRLLASVAMRRR